MTLVNVYIPTYNPKPEHLRAAVDSVLKQTLAEWTVLVHDDASSVDVRSILEPYLKDSRISFIRSDKRLGIGGNWNACMKHGDAPFVQYLFQDDTWEPDYLRLSADALRTNASLAFVASNHAYAMETSTPASSLYAEVEARRKTMRSTAYDGKKYLMQWIESGLYPNVIGEPSFVMMRRESVNKAGPFLEDMPQGLDMEYWTRLLLTGDMHYLQADLGAFRVHASAASAQNEQSGAGIYDRLRCFERIIAALPAGADRDTAIAARNRALDTMVAKFFTRMKGGQTVPVRGSGALKTFCMRHPVLIIRAVVKYWIHRIAGRR
jgi:glycosyltransferase involved in cell wall biosynthesis